jgi:hypothetical protein
VAMAMSAVPVAVAVRIVVVRGAHFGSKAPTSWPEKAPANCR